MNKSYNATNENSFSIHAFVAKNILCVILTYQFSTIKKPEIFSGFIFMLFQAER
jgi:hypothetical protein